jgi:hypothetical protein
MIAGSSGRPTGAKPYKRLSVSRSTTLLGFLRRHPFVEGRWRLRDIRGAPQHGARAPAKRLEADMQHYKFFFMDDTGHVFRSEDHSCPDDRAALESAKKLNALHPVEIWQAGRQIARVKQDVAELNVLDQRSL